MKLRCEYRVTHPEIGKGFHVEARRGKRAPWEPVATSESYDLALRIIMLETYGRGIHPLSELLNVAIPERGCGL